MTVSSIKPSSLGNTLEGIKILSTMNFDTENLARILDYLRSYPSKSYKFSIEINFSQILETLIIILLTFLRSKITLKISSFFTFHIRVSSSLIKVFFYFIIFIWIIFVKTNFKTTCYESKQFLLIFFCSFPKICLTNWKLYQYIIYSTHPTSNFFSLENVRIYGNFSNWFHCLSVLLSRITLNSLGNKT